MEVAAFFFLEDLKRWMITS